MKGQYSTNEIILAIERLGQRITLVEQRLNRLEGNPVRGEYTIREMMARYKVSRRTICNWMKKGYFTITRTPAGKPRLRVLSLPPTHERKESVS